MKIIFLDIDVVLNDAATTDRCGARVSIDKYCLSRLKNVIGFIIVVVLVIVGVIIAIAESYVKQENRKLDKEAKVRQ